MSEKKEMALEVETTETEPEQTVHLSHGRTLDVATQGADQVLEIRADSGQVELRIKMTEQGPVLQVEAVKLEVKAAESIEMECKNFKVAAAESIEMAAEGEAKVQSKGELTVESSDNDVRVRGKLIWLN